jgi:hypothetical protein
MRAIGPGKNELTAMADKQCVLLFVKAPEKGKVKSRLSRSMGEDTVLHLYECFVLDVMEMLKAGGIPFRICFTPAEKRQAITAWLGKGQTYLPQEGVDLGERMANAFQQTFSEGITEALIIGSDLPDLPHALLEEAFRSLHAHDAVIGPAVDGGYYLIGFRRETFLPEVFRGRTWSTNTVLPETMELFKRSAYRVHQLPEWRDVDALEDLRALLLRNTQTDFRTSGTMTYLIQNRRDIFNE